MSRYRRAHAGVNRRCANIAARSIVSTHGSHADSQQGSSMPSTIASATREASRSGSSPTSVQHCRMTSSFSAVFSTAIFTPRECNSLRSRGVRRGEGAGLRLAGLGPTLKQRNRANLRRRRHSPHPGRKTEMRRVPVATTTTTSRCTPVRRCEPRVFDGALEVASDEDGTLARDYAALRGRADGRSEERACPRRSAGN